MQNVWAEKRFSHGFVCWKSPGGEKQILSIIWQFSKWQKCSGNNLSKMLSLWICLFRQLPAPPLFWRGLFLVKLAGKGEGPQRQPTPPLRQPQWGCLTVISEKSTRIGPQLDGRRTESRHVATPSCCQQSRRWKAYSLLTNVLSSSSSVKNEHKEWKKPPQSTFYYLKAIHELNIY